MLIKFVRFCHADEIIVTLLFYENDVCLQREITIARCRINHVVLFHNDPFEISKQVASAEAVIFFICDVKQFSPAIEKWTLLFTQLALLMFMTLGFWWTFTSSAMLQLNTSHFQMYSSLADLGGAPGTRPPHLPGILVFDDILGHIV